MYMNRFEVFYDYKAYKEHMINMLIKGDIGVLSDSFNEDGELKRFMLSGYVNVSDFLKHDSLSIEEEIIEELSDISVHHRTGFNYGDDREASQSYDLVVDLKLGVPINIDRESLKDHLKEYIDDYIDMYVHFNKELEYEYRNGELDKRVVDSIMEKRSEFLVRKNNIVSDIMDLHDILYVNVFKESARAIKLAYMYNIIDMDEARSGLCSIYDAVSQLSFLVNSRFFYNFIDEHIKNIDYKSGIKNFLTELDMDASREIRRYGSLNFDNLMMMYIKYENSVRSGFITGDLVDFEEDVIEVEMTTKGDK